VKITQKQLNQLIQEELAQVLNENKAATAAEKTTAVAKGIANTVLHNPKGIAKAAVSKSGIKALSPMQHIKTATKTAAKKALETTGLGDVGAETANIGMKLAREKAKNIKNLPLFKKWDPAKRVEKYVQKGVQSGLDKAYQAAVDKTKGTAGETAVKGAAGTASKFVKAFPFAYALALQDAAQYGAEKFAAPGVGDPDFDKDNPEHVKAYEETIGTYADPKLARKTRYTKGEPTLAKAIQAQTSPEDLEIRGGDPMTTTYTPGSFEEKKAEARAQAAGTAGGERARGGKVDFDITGATHKPQTKILELPSARAGNEKLSPEELYAQTREMAFKYTKPGGKKMPSMVSDELKRLEKKVTSRKLAIAPETLKKAGAPYKVRQGTDRAKHAWLAKQEDLKAGKGTKKEISAFKRKSKRRMLQNTLKTVERGSKEYKKAARSLNKMNAADKRKRRRKDRVAREKLKTTKFRPIGSGGRKTWSKRKSRSGPGFFGAPITQQRQYKSDPSDYGEEKFFREMMLRQEPHLTTTKRKLQMTQEQLNQLIREELKQRHNLQLAKAGDKAAQRSLTHQPPATPPAPPKPKPVDKKDIQNLSWLTKENQMHITRKRLSEIIREELIASSAAAVTATAAKPPEEAPELRAPRTGMAPVTTDMREEEEVVQEKLGNLYSAGSAAHGIAGAKDTKGATNAVISAVEPIPATGLKMVQKNLQNKAEKLGSSLAGARDSRINRALTGKKEKTGGFKGTRKTHGNFRSKHGPGQDFSGESGTIAHGEQPFKKTSSAATKLANWWQKKGFEESQQSDVSESDLMNMIREEIMNALK